METPRDRDGAFALVRNVRRRAEAPERSLGGAQACEEHHVRSLFCLTDVASSRVAVERRGRLTFPVNEFGADRVITVSRCRREGASGLVERKREQVSLTVFVPPHAGLPGDWPDTAADVESG